MGAFTTAALAATAIGMQAYGQYQQGVDAQAAANFNAQVYKQQAEVTDVKKGLTSYQYDRAIRQLKGASVTAVSSSGYDLSGSKLLVMEDAITEAELDKSIEIYNLEVDKTRAISSAKEYEIRGQRERRSSVINAGSTLLTQGNDWYSKYGSDLGFGPTKGKE